MGPEREYELTEKETTLTSPEEIRDHIWYPGGKFGEFEKDVVAGNSTKSLMRAIGLEKANKSAETFKLVKDPERADFPFGKKTKLGKALVGFIRRLDPEADPHNIIYPELNHTTNIACIDEKFVKAESTGGDLTRQRLPETDGVITNLKGYPLLALCADCPPVVVYDPKNQAVGLFHSGWKGTVGDQRPGEATPHGIAPRGVELMAEKYKSNPADLVVAIGPHISQKNYEVEEYIYKKYVEAYIEDEIAKIFRPSNKPGHYFLDLGQAIKISLVNSGVKEENIQISTYCTYDNNDLLSSFRAEQDKETKGDLADRTGFSIMLKESEQNG